MKPILYVDGTAGKQAATHPVGVVKLECRVNTAGAASLFFQVHDSAVVPIDTAVPLKSWETAGGSSEYKEFKNGELPLSKGLYACISTTEATKTLGTGNNKFSMLSVELFDPEQPTGTTVAGDEVTNIAERLLWATASGPKRLIEIVVNDVAGVLVGEVPTNPVYIAIFPHNAAGSTESGMLFRQVTLSARNVFHFGLDGLDVKQTISGVAYIGCRIALISAASGTVPTYADILTTGCPIKAEYK